MPNQSEYLDLTVRYLNNPQDADLRSQILSFRSESPDNESYFKELERLWLFSSAAGRLSLLNHRQNEKRFKSILTPKASTSVTFRKWMSGIAASFLLIGLLLMWLKYESVEVVIAKTNRSQIDTIYGSTAKQPSKKLYATFSTKI